MRCISFFCVVDKALCGKGSSRGGVVENKKRPKTERLTQRRWETMNEQKFMGNGPNKNI